ncbi:Pre-mRNA-splicing factor [Nymphaea thermarum]|nr:Pre-mRNA-splicing factor [Nymphaea thermarum]
MTSNRKRGWLKEAAFPTGCRWNHENPIHLSLVRIKSAEMSEEDHYAVLGLPSGIEGTKISESEIRKAYKAKALRYHPDKRPDDPTAAARFMTIQTSYEILVDVSARKAYDDLLKLKHEQQQRQNQVSAKRRKMMDKLEEEERAFASNAKSQAEMDRAEIERAKKKIEEEIARILSMKAKQASSTSSKKENVGNNSPQPVSLDKSKIIEVTWRHSKDVSDVQRLYELFGKFGVVEDVVIRSKKALVVMASRDSVVSATESFFVDDLNALRIRPLCPVTTVSSSPFEEKLDDVPEYSNLVGAAFHTHEESILQKLKQVWIFLLFVFILLEPYLRS